MVRKEILFLSRTSWTLEQPRLPPRVESRPLRGCLCLPAMALPESYKVGPAFARAYYMGNDNKMHCLLPCSNEPFCPFHSACGRAMHPDSLEHADDHKGHLCSRCKEFLDKRRTLSSGSTAYLRRSPGTSLPPSPFFA